jgi:hypothetical protein
MEALMQFCHWCSKKIKQGRFCGVECLQAAAEMPELINHKYLETPTKVRSSRRIALGVIGALALVGGSIAALWPAHTPEPSIAEPFRGCVMVASTLEPTPILIHTQVAKGPVSAFIYTNTTSAKTSEIDAMVQSTLPNLQELYGSMMLHNNGLAPNGLLELSFLIQQDGSVTWVSRVSNSVSPVLDSAAIKGLQQLHFNESPVLTTTETLTVDRFDRGVEVKVMYRFGEDTTKNLQNQRDVMPYFNNVIR